MHKRAPKQESPSVAGAETVRVARKFGRFHVDCDAVLSFPQRHAHPRVKAHMFQIGSGGCALTTKSALYIGEECLVWASAGGEKLLGARARVVWMKSVYDRGQATVVGLEFSKALELNPDLLERLGKK